MLNQQKLNTVGEIKQTRIIITTPLGCFMLKAQLPLAPAVDRQLEPVLTHTSDSNAPPQKMHLGFELLKTLALTRPKQVEHQLTENVRQHLRG